MAECLVLAFEPGTTDDLAWRLGHVIDVKSDGWTWGASERLPKYWVVTVTGATVGDCGAYVAALAVGGVATKLRDKKLSPDKLPAAARTALYSTGRISVTKAQADAYFGAA